MSQEVITRDDQQMLAGHVSGRGNSLPMQVNAGAVSIEIERAVAEAKGQMQLAKMFPRDLNDVHAQFMKSCKMPAFANVAFYSVPQGGSKVTGPSIRFAEEIARVFENFEYGHRELSRIEAGPGPKDFGRSEVEIYAWDKQTNNRQIRQITVLHVLDTKDGKRKLRDEKDIDNKIANVASKQMRGRIIAMMPKWLVEEGMEECRKTLSGNNSEPLDVRVRKMTQAFATYGVTTDHLAAYLGHPLDQVLADELVNLTGVYNALKEGTPASEFFGGEKEPEKDDKTAAALADAAKGASKPASTGGPAAAARQQRQRAADKPPAAEQQAKQEAAPQDSKPVEEKSKPVEEPAPEVTETQSQSEPAADQSPTTDQTDQEGGDLF